MSIVARLKQQQLSFDTKATQGTEEEDKQSVNTAVLQRKGRGRNKTQETKVAAKRSKCSTLESQEVESEDEEENSREGIRVLKQLFPPPEDALLVLNFACKSVLDSFLRIFRALVSTCSFVVHLSQDHEDGWQGLVTKFTNPQGTAIVYGKLYAQIQCADMQHVIQTTTNNTADMTHRLQLELPLDLLCKQLAAADNKYSIQLVLRKQDNGQVLFINTFPTSNMTHMTSSFVSIKSTHCELATTTHKIPTNLMVILDLAEVKKVLKFAYDAQVSELHFYIFSRQNTFVVVLAYKTEQSQSENVFVCNQTQDTHGGLQTTMGVHMDARNFALAELKAQYCQVVDVAMFYNFIKDLPRSIKLYMSSNSTTDQSLLIVSDLGDGDSSVTFALKPIPGSPLTLRTFRT